MRKDEVVQKLNQVLMVQGIHWERLPGEDLLKLCEAFEKLRLEIEQVFALFDEITGEAPLAPPSEDKGEWRHYTT